MNTMMFMGMLYNILANKMILMASLHCVIKLKKTHSIVLQCTLKNDDNNATYTSAPRH